MTLNIWLQIKVLMIVFSENAVFFWNSKISMDIFVHIVQIF